MCKREKRVGRGMKGNGDLYSQEVSRGEERARWLLPIVQFPNGLDLVKGSKNRSLPARSERSDVDHRVNCAKSCMDNNHFIGNWPA